MNIAHSSAIRSTEKVLPTLLDRLSRFLASTSSQMLPRIQAKEATESAFKDGKQLLQDYHLYQVPHRCCLSDEKVLVCFCSADAEGEIEMRGSMLLITELCDHFVPTKKATHTKNACGGGQDHVPHYCLHGTRSEITHGADPRLGG
nr:uncharacterized protein LOC127316632 isoform X2 [Lolium perenne]